MKREYFIISGFCSCIVAFVLYFADGPGYWTQFILLFLIPSLLTFAPMLWLLSDRYMPKLPSRLSVPARILLMFLPIVVIIFQLFIVGAWAISFIDWPVPVLVHFWGYFFLIGLVCTITVLLRMAAPQPQQQVS